MRKLDFTGVAILEALPTLDPKRQGMSVSEIHRRVKPERYTRRQIERALAELVDEGLLKRVTKVELGDLYLHLGEDSLKAAAVQRELRKLERMKRKGKLEIRPGRLSRPSALAEEA